MKCLLTASKADGMLQRIGTLFLPQPQLGAIEIKGFAGTVRTGLQLTSGV